MNTPKLPQWKAQTYQLWHALGLFSVSEIDGRWYAMMCGEEVVL